MGLSVVKICLNKFSFKLGSSWYQMRNKTCYIPKISKFYVEKGYLWYGSRLESWIFNIQICILQTRT